MAVAGEGTEVSGASDVKLDVAHLVTKEKKDEEVITRRCKQNWGGGTVAGEVCDRYF